MTKDSQPNNLEILLSLHKEILSKWSELNKSSPESNRDFWSDLSHIRMLLKDFFQAFGALDKREKVNQWHILNELSLISVLIEA